MYVCVAPRQEGLHIFVVCLLPPPYSPICLLVPFVAVDKEKKAFAGAEALPTPAMSLTAFLSC